MDRDAPPVPVPPSDPTRAVPPDPPGLVRVVGLVGVGMNLAAAALGVAAALANPPPAVLTPVQLFLAFAGTVTAGAAVSMRPDLWWTWGLGAAAALLGSFGLPASWDSFPPLFRAAAGVGVAGMVVCVASNGWRVAIASAAVLFHFSGIFAATTSPPPQPWIVEQAWVRVYQPYLNFVYLRNAYHFYSPNPGPASLLVFLVKTETGVDPQTRQKQYKTQWVIMPKRPDDIRDPLGLSYYRRLSLTEHTARGGSGLAFPTDRFEKEEVLWRRTLKAGAIPLHPLDDRSDQYRLPNTEIIRYVLPSYASHVILEHTKDKEEAARTTVKIYRVEHRTTAVEQFVKQLPDGEYASPYHPGTYRPYYQGEFGFVPDPDNPGKAKIDLLNPKDDMLYWLIPIFPRQPGPGDPNKKPYLDFMSAHALDMKIDDVVAAKEDDPRVFDWRQLR